MMSEGAACSDASPDAVKERFNQFGYAVIEQAIPLAEIDHFWAQFDTMREHDGAMRFAEYDKIYLGSDQAIAGRKQTLRAINTFNRSPLSRVLATHANITRYLDLIFGGPVVAIQSLSYSQSSRQGAHSDMFLVDPPYVGGYPRETLCAAWIACEDADERNGALVVYPGSHRLKKRKLDEFPSYGAYVAYLVDLCAGAGIYPQPFRARKGDVLLWHGDFVHAGGEPEELGKSRASLVVHYAVLPEASLLQRPACIWNMNGRFVLSSRDD